jgi:hypothetical protein
MISFNVARALWTLHRLQSELLPDVAANLLEQGQDTPTIRLLAGLVRPTAREVEPLFATVINEMKLQPLCDHEAALIVAKHIAQETLVGNLSPLDCASRIAGLCTLVNYAEPFSEFMHLEDLWQCMPESRSGIEADIIKAANELLQPKIGP